MDFKELRELIETEGGKIILLEEGKAPLVVATLEEYKKAKYSSQPPINFGAQFAADVPQLPKELAEEPLKIDDLPV